MTYYRLRDVAVSSNAFQGDWNGGVVITTGKSYQGYRPTGACEGEKVVMTAVVNGKAVTIDAVLAGGNYFVPAGFLASLGVTI